MLTIIPALTVGLMLWVAFIGFFCGFIFAAALMEGVKKENKNAFRREGGLYDAKRN